LAELCRDKGVRVRLCKEGEFDYASASGRFTVGILALLAQMEAELAQERARDTITARRVRGDHVGSAGYGKRLVRGKLVDEPREDVATIVGAYRDAGSFNGAARLLNERRVRTKSGRSWESTTVARIIRREAPAETEGKRIEPRVKQRGSFAFSRLLRCPCGNVLTGRRTNHTTKYGSYGPYISYQCYRGRHDASHPRPYMVSEAVLMDFVKSEAARLRVPRAVAGSVDDGARSKLEARRRRVIDNYEDGLIDKTERDQKLAAITEEMQRLDAVGAVSRLPDAIDWDWPLSTLNDVLRTVWDRIELGPDLLPIPATPERPTGGFGWLVPGWRN
jgi:hypothetical protein